jgi:hypothetical protein
MTAGLVFLHDRGIVHRDLKPANVYIDQQIVKIGDIGLSKSISNSRRNEQTQSVGTVYYMAPEVAHGRYGHEVDVYSLGIVLYEMITGRVPFDGETAGEILMKHLSAQPDLSPLPPRLQPVLAHALQKDPARRTPNAAELLSEFRRALRGETIAEEIPDESFVQPQSAQPIPVRTDRRQPVGTRRDESPWIGENEYRSQRPWGRVDHRQVGRRWSWAASALVGVLVLMAIGGGGAIVGLVRLVARFGILVGIVYGGCRLAGLFFSSVGRVFGPRGGHAERSPLPDVVFDGEHPRLSETLPVVSRDDVHKRAGHVVHNRSHVDAVLGPEAQRSIPVKHRVAELTGSLAYAVFITGAITIGLCLVTPSFFGVTGDFGAHAGHVLKPGGVALFALTTILGAWAILIPSKLTEGSASESRRRRFSQLITGAIVGGAAYWLDRMLLVDLRYDLWGRSDNIYSAFPTLGVQPLTESVMQPALLGYVVFFAGLFWLRSWWRHADAFRRKRFRLSSVLLTTLLGFGLPLLFAFPHGWGVMWAVSISSVVQLSAAWVPPDERRRVLEDHTDG